MMFVMLLQRDVPQAVRFYRDGLGLRVGAASPRWAELEAPGGGGRIALKQADGEAQSTVGYSPFLAFEVPDLQARLERLLELGGRMDGGISYTPYGKAAAVRCPDGHMISLYEGDQVAPGGAAELPRFGGGEGLGGAPGEG